MKELFPGILPNKAPAQRNAISAVRAQLIGGLIVSKQALQSIDMRQALDVAANVIHRVDKVHGNGQRLIRTPHTGNYASFHHGLHTREVATGGPNYLVQAGERDAATLARSLLSGAYHDIIQGQGAGPNEELSAQIAERELMAKGYEQAEAQNVGDAVRGTQLVVANGHIRQKSYDSRDQVAVATAVGDLGGLAQKWGAVRSLTLFGEFNADLFSSHEGVLTQERTMRIIDAAPEGRRRFGGYILQQGDFFEGVEYPAATNGAVDELYTMRSQNADYLRNMGNLMLDGVISAPEAYAAAFERAQ